MLESIPNEGRGKLPKGSRKRTYFVYAKLLGWDKARLVTFFDKEFEKYGTTTIDSILMWRHRHLTSQQTTR
jgi:hypothetical protein